MPAPRLGCQTGCMSAPANGSSRGFASIYSHGFVRVAAGTPPVALAEPATNAERILAAARDAHADGAALAVFPELSLTGYSIEDLLLQQPMIDAVIGALVSLTEQTHDLLPVLVVGAPLRWRHRLYNCAVVIHRGEVLGVVPKSLVPTYREFYEGRYFASGAQITGEEISIGGWKAPFGTDLLFAATDYPDLVLGVEICEDMWVPVPPGARAALAGATVLANLSGSPVTVGRAEERHLLCRSASVRYQAAYVYTAAGTGESSNDLSWDGQAMVYEAGDLLTTTPRFATERQLAVADVHLARLRGERLHQGTFDDNAPTAPPFRTVGFQLDPPSGDLGLRRAVDRFPYVPDDPERLAQDCYEAFNIQVTALVQRMSAIGSPKLVIGVSGGLDSTHALLVAARAMDRLGRPRSDILGYTLPGFATSEGTRSNAWRLGEALGVTFTEIDITAAARQMLTDIGHPFAAGEPVYDVTFENVQAGLRTDYLFRIANAQGGIVVGTGDLSELALGWCTYGVGDQMSHYGVNAGVPKTLIQHLVRWVVTSGEVDPATAEVLTAVLGTTISPELVPTGEDGKAQSTEDQIGPYALHDFTLFHLLRHGLAPRTIAFLAHHAWHDPQAGSWPPGYPEGDRPGYDLAQIRHWLAVFCRRFFANQFKRTALPNGPKVAHGGALSPRGEWRAPSDVGSAVWLADLERVPEHWPSS